MVVVGKAHSVRRGAACCAPPRRGARAGTRQESASGVTMGREDVEVALLVLGFAPGLFWLWHYYRKDAYQPEPRRLVLKLFVLGMLVTIPVGIAELLIDSATGL